MARNNNVKEIFKKVMVKDVSVTSMLRNDCKGMLLSMLLLI